jgi:hypothetical protein
MIAQSLSAEIYEIRLTIGNLACPYCAKVLVDDLKTIQDIRGVKIWALEGLGLVEWKQESPFRVVDLFDAFKKTQFILEQVEIDVEGTIEEKSGALILRSLPDNSFFHIDNRHDIAVSHLRPGDTVRLKGVLSSRRDRNVLNVTAVLPEV